MTQRLVDNLFLFADEAAAKADPVIGAYFSPGDEESPGSWRGDVCISNVRVSTIIPGTPEVLDEQGNVVTPAVEQTLKPWSYWYIIIGGDKPELIDHPSLAISIDWTSNVIIRSTLPAGTTIHDYVVEPYFMGRDPGSLK